MKLGLAPLALPQRERQFAIAAFGTLVFLMAGHAMLETARDALFLARVPVTRLPWLYLVIALFSTVIGQLDGRAGRTGPRGLTGLVVGGAVATLGVGQIVVQWPNAGVYVLYIWTAVQTAVISLRFWTLLGGLFTVTQAKQVYGFIGGGSVLGAVLGAGASRLVAEWLPASALVPAASALLFGAALCTSLFWKVCSIVAIVEDSSGGETLLDAFRALRREPLGLGLLWLTVITTITVTVVDFLFKQTVAQHVPSQDLGAFMATANLAFNAGSLLVQLLLVSWVVRRFNLQGALVVLPLLILAGGTLLWLAPSILALTSLLGLKGVDGVLRYTLNRTAVEIVLVPLPVASRRRTKLVSDLLGQRGGQALASLLILGVNFWSWAPMLPLLLMGAAGLWLIAAYRLRKPYMALMRGQLRPLTRVEPLPEMDVHSLESLVMALDSVVVSEVVAAMDLLEREHRAHLVPNLILHHPEDEVVVHALALFARTRRMSALPVMQRIIGRRGDRVRAAVLRASFELQADETELTALVEPLGPATRGTYLIYRLARGSASVPEQQELRTIVATSDPAVQLSLAEDVRVFNSHHLDAVIRSLLKAPSLEVRLRVLQALDVGRFPLRAPDLLDALTDARCRDRAHEVIASLGEAGVSLVRKGLDDPGLSLAVRQELPHAATFFPESVANELLQNRLAVEPHDRMRTWLLRALNRTVQLSGSPRSRLDKALLATQVQVDLQQAYWYLSTRILLIEQGAQMRKLRGFQFLVRLLEDKERSCAERVFMVLNLMRADEDFCVVWRSLQSRDARVRAAALELVDNALTEPLRTAVRGLIADQSDVARLQSGRDYLELHHRSYGTLLDELEATGSQSLRELSTFHRSELGGIPIDLSEPGPLPVRLREVLSAG